MQFKIRPYHPSDLTSLYKICLLTGNSGKDATKLLCDPDLIGHLYVAPYAIFEPDVCFVITNSEKPCGYIIGTKDSQKFYQRCEKDWFPTLRTRYPLAKGNDKSFNAMIIKRLHEGYKEKEELRNYQAHLHIDILPIAQGQGLGRKAMNIFIDKLKEFNISALHLEVGKKNHTGIKFYKKLGFHIIKEFEHSIAFGIKLK